MKIVQLKLLIIHNRENPPNQYIIDQIINHLTRI